MPTFDFGKAAADLESKEREQTTFDMGKAAQGLSGQTARQNIQSVADTNPDMAAKALVMSKEAELPVDVVERNPAQVQAGLDFDRAARALDGRPATERAFADPTTAKVAKDSVDHMAAAEESWLTPITEGAADFGLSAAAGVVGDFGGGSLSGLGELYESAGRSLARPIYGALDALGMEDFSRSIQELRVVPWYMNPSEILKRPGQDLKEIGDSISGDVEEPDSLTNQVGRGLGQVAGQIAAAIATGGASSVTSLLSMFGMGADQQSGMLEAAGADPTSAEADAAILSGGIVTAITERYGLDNLMNRIPQAFRSRIMRTIIGAASEGSQELVESVLQNLVAYSLYDPDADIFEGAAEGAEVGSIVGGIVGMILPGRTAIKHRDSMDRSVEALAGSPVAERSPEVAAAHMAEVMSDAGVSEIMVPVERLDEAAIAAGDPDAFYDALGISPQHLEEARSLGGDVLVQPQAFAQHIMLSDAYEGLKDHVRLGSEAMSAAEAEAFAKGGVADIVASINESAEPQNVWQRGQATLDAETEASLRDDPDGASRDAETDPEISDEADLAVTIAEQSMGLQAMTSDALNVGIGSKMYKGYLAAIQRVKENARNRQQKAILKEQQRALTKEWNEELDRERSIAAETLSNEPLYTAANSIQKDRLDRVAVIEAFGGDATQLPRMPKTNGRSIVAAIGEPGIDPDLMAEQYGFDSAQHMILQMAHMPNFDQAVETKAQNDMKLRHGTLTNQMTAVANAIQELATDRTAEVLALELQQLRDDKKAGRIKPSQILALANANLLDHKVNDIRPQVFLRQQQKHAREAGKLVRAGDRPAAARAKFQQLLNLQYAAAAFNVRKKVEQQKTYMKKFLRRTDRPGIDADYLDRIKDLVGRHDLGKKYADLTLRDWNDLVDEVKFLEAQGRALKEYRIGERKAKFAEVKDEMLTVADSLPTLSRVERQKLFQNPSAMDETKALVAHGRAKLNKVEFMLNRMDGGTPGIWHKAIYERVAASSTSYQDLLKQTVQPAVDALKDVTSKRELNRKIRVPLLGRSFRRRDLLMLALNVGNVSNYNKLIEGSAKDRNGIPWTPEGVDQALQLANFTDAEWDWVQSIWDVSEKNYPAVEAIFREENGRSPEKIEPREYTTPSGRIVKGGYFPMMYDPRRDVSGGADRVSTMDMMDNPAVRGSVYSGMTKARTGYSAPVLLDLAALPRALEQAAYFSTHFSAVKDVRRVLNDTDLGGALQDKLGPEAHEEMKNWVNDIATGNTSVGELKGWDNFVDALRGNVTTAVLGLSYTTLVSQTFGLSTSVAVLGKGADGKFSSREGVKWMAIGMDRYWADWSGSVEQARSLSGLMRHRLNNVDRDITHAHDRMIGKGGPVSSAKRATLIAIGGMQFYTVDMPTWIGAYNKALSEGRIGDDAVQFADSVVRTSQGSGNLMDLSAIQRKKGIMRWMTMFSTYSMTLYNLLAETAKDATKVKNAASTMARAMWLLTIPAMADALLRQEAPDDDEDEDPATWFLLQNIALATWSVPIIGSQISSAVQGYDPTMTPVSMIGVNTVRALDIVYNRWEDEEELTEKDYAAITAAVGPIIGLPGTFQLGRALKALDAEGDASWYDYLIGYKDD